MFRRPCGAAVCTVASQKDGRGASSCLCSVCMFSACPKTRTWGHVGTRCASVRVSVNVTGCVSSMWPGDLSRVWPCLHLIDLYDPECGRKLVLVRQGGFDYITIRNDYYYIAEWLCFSLNIFFGGEKLEQNQARSNLTSLHRHVGNTVWVGFPSAPVIIFLPSCSF